MSCYCDDLFVSALQVDKFLGFDTLTHILPSSTPNYLNSKDSLSNWLRVSNGDRLITKIGQMPIFDIKLNTALSSGNDAIKLMARLHGQCEVHCYVEGPNRNWLASIMRMGRRLHLYRDNEGWEAVIALLESNSVEPVVCSYSVCDSFPNEGMLSKKKKNFDDLSSQERWNICMEHLRKNKNETGLELTPDHWDETYWFGLGNENGYSVYEFARKLKAERDESP